jgi:hypothetical protein
MPNAPSLSPDAADEPKALAFIKEIFEHKEIVAAVAMLPGC